MSEKLLNMPPFIVICGIMNTILIVIVQMYLAAKFVFSNAKIVVMLSVKFYVRC